MARVGGLRWAVAQKLRGERNTRRERYLWCGNVALARSPHGRAHAERFADRRGCSARLCGGEQAPAMCSGRGCGRGAFPGGSHHFVDADRDVAAYHFDGLSWWENCGDQGPGGDGHCRCSGGRPRSRGGCSGCRKSARSSPVHCQGCAGGVGDQCTGAHQRADRHY